MLFLSVEGLDKSFELKLVINLVCLSQGEILSLNTDLGK